MNYPNATKIIKIKEEAPCIKTITFECHEKVTPGQFFMIWIPGADEIPMSVSYIGKDVKGITFKKVGDATKALFKLKQGDRIGVRGPYGNGFKLKGKNILFVGGGTGIAMVAPAIEEAASKKISTSVVMGARNKNELFFENRIRKCTSKIYVSTDDGSKGAKGFSTDLAAELLTKQKFDLVLTCGPELMMKKLFGLCQNMPFQASMERYIKCGIGLCGQCCVGEGLRVCKDGPVFDEKTLRGLSDFGVYTKDASGRKIKL